jgi:phenylpropionate dioxygenase-like ring-hydroxylating dioxygenase large terminal subunit
MARAVPRWAAKYPELGTGALPIDPYIEPEYLDLERDHIFRTAWLNVCRIDDVPEPGSYFVREIELLKASVLITHAADGVIRAFHNVCSHRANKLVWETEGSCRGYLSCCFHGWTYDLKGQLCGVLDEENFHDLDKATLGLTPLASDVWHGFIFVNFQPEPEETLEEYLGDLVDELRDHPLDKLSLSFRFDVEDNANWKVALDAQNEIYHLPVLGPVHGAFTDFFATNEEGCTRNNEFKRFGRHTLFSTTMNPEYTPVGLEKFILDVPITGLEMPTNGVFDFYVIFPNMVVAFLPGSMFTYNFWPLAVDKTIWEARMYFPPAASAAEMTVQHYRKTKLRDALAEDVAGHENVHAGLLTRAKTEFVLQDEEVQIRSFHHSWREYLDAANADLPAAVS